MGKLNKPSKGGHWIFYTGERLRALARLWVNLRPWRFLGEGDYNKCAYMQYLFRESLRKLLVRVEYNKINDWSGILKSHSASINMWATEIDFL